MLDGLDRLQRHVAALYNMSHHYLNASFAIRPGVRLRWLSPAAIEQMDSRGEAGGWWMLRLPHNRRKNANAFVGVRTAQRPYVGWYFLT